MIADQDGRRLVDAADPKLQVVGYIVAVQATLSLDVLRSHLHSLPDHPHWMPYQTSYYHRTWGFCLADRVLQGLGPGPLRGARRRRAAASPRRRLSPGMSRA